ncbi:MAG: hypothetical protein RMJ88_16795 [Thermogemmata sp.]|nr:hypothetical protein [Thermogemmata sp.]
MTDYPSPFTIPTPQFVFAEDLPSDAPPPPLPTTVGELIRKLIDFAHIYNSLTATIAQADPFERLHHLGGRDAIAYQLQQQFARLEGIEAVRSLVLRRYGEELTVSTARRLLQDLIRECSLSVAEAEALSLPAAADLLCRSSGPTQPTGAGPACPSAKPKMKSRKHRGFTLEEANVRVRDHLVRCAERGIKITRDGVAQALGLSTGMVSRTPSWQVYQKHLKEHRKGSVREVPLTEDLLGCVPSQDKQLDQLIREQAADMEEQERRWQRWQQRRQ